MIEDDARTREPDADSGDGGYVIVVLDKQRHEIRRSSFGLASKTST